MGQPRCCNGVYAAKGWGEKTTFGVWGGAGEKSVKGGKVFFAVTAGRLQKMGPPNGRAPPTHHPTGEHHKTRNDRGG